MSLRLSIVIPFYNVELYISQCLDSVYSQDIPEEAYEVICVNDASPDHSRDIVLEYQKKHSNLILVEHEVNKKLGAARNTGRKIARGKYIWNVDSDDMIAPNCLGSILNVCEKNELDVLLFSFKRLVNGDLQDREIEPWIGSNDVYTGLTFWKMQVLKNQAEISPVWTQVYRRAYLDEKAIYSPEINMSEDVPYTYASILLANHLSLTNIPYYIYRDNASSLSKELRVKPTSKMVYENCFVCSKCLENLCRRIPKTEKEVIQSIRSVESYMLLSMWELMKFMTAKDIKQLKRLCRKNFFNNRFVFVIFGKKNSMKYIQFVLKQV